MIARKCKVVVRPTEAQREETYYCRKQYHSLNVQLICNANMEFTSVDASFGGATHDSFIWNAHPIKTYMERLNETTWLLETVVLSEKGLLDEKPEEYMSHKEKYENSIRKAVMLYRKLQAVEDPNMTYEEKQEAYFRNTITAAVFKENSPFLLHFGMFMPTIISQGDEEQAKYWQKRAMNMEIIGTYVQTELGHGTFIRGLETTATYDEGTEEFVINSPTLTAYKWWPGGLGQTANYCVVMAQLYSKGKNCGIQSFLVQLRDEETHIPLPGIKLGEIGAKLNFNTVNNGFLGFENHRIPRNRMLMKSAQVLKDGTFKASPNPKLVYGTMVYARVVIVNTASVNLARAATIAVRYSAVRRQSKLKSHESEIQVLDYLTQQHKLFIAVSTSYAYSLCARWIWNRYKEVNRGLRQGQADQLPELHILACSLKVLSSGDCSAHIEKCRLSCGGHGYMLSSYLPQLYGLCTAACTYEGENTVLLLQVARSLVKAWDQVESGVVLSPSMSYLSDRTPPTTWDSSIDGIIGSFQKMSIGKLSEAVRSLKRYAQSVDPEDAWNLASVQLTAAAEAHARVLVLSIYKTAVDNCTLSASPALRQVMTSLLELYAIYWSLEKTGDLLLYTKLTAKDVRNMQKRYEELLKEIRPNAVGLVDAFDFRDEALNSTLGAYDGRAYERLMEEAMKSPLNQEPVNETFHKYLKPFMKGKL